MIPILFESGTTTYTTNGLGRLRDCTKCTVTEERNGIYECEFSYPISGTLYDEIEIGRLIACEHDEKGDIQPFEIYSRTVPDLNGIVTFNAHHISYLLNEVIVKPFTASSCAAALAAIKSNSANSNPFTFWTDKSTTATFKSLVPRQARNMLGGEENSILDVFGGGEYEFDKFTVKLYAARGTDSGVVIRYGKNLTDLNYVTDNAGTYNAVAPYWQDADGHAVVLPETYITRTGIGSERVSVISLDMSGDFEEQPTVIELRTAAQTYLDNNNGWLPSENITVDFVQLWQTDEYEGYSALQRVGLCDTVTIWYPDAGVADETQKVVKVVYNVLLDRYDSMELGTLSTSLGQAIKQSVLETVPTTSMMEAAIQYATDMIRGGLGGYVVMTPGDNGYPQEILIMDTPDINTAVNVWRFNRGGLGHSSSGYEGPYSDIALTQDGRINASMITTGYLNANYIKAGTISDETGANYWDLSNGEFAMTDGSINLGSGNFVASSTGKLTSIGGGVIRDSSSNVVLDMDNGTFVMKAGSINLGSGNFIASSTGVLTATSGTISAFTFTRTALIYYNSSNVKTMQLSNSALWFGGTRAYVQGSSAAYMSTINSRGLQLYATTSSTAPEDADLFATLGLVTNTSGETYFVISTNYSSPNNYWVRLLDPTLYSTPIHLDESTNVSGNFTCGGTKSRVVETDNYSNRLLYCYETPTPLFGDIGEAMLDEDGVCYVDIDDIFTETIAGGEYQVFLQAEGEGTCYIAEKNPRYFVIRGTPNLKVAWELKAKQKNYQNIRLEPEESGLDEYAYETESLIDDYIEEQEALLYG